MLTKTFSASCVAIVALSASVSNAGCPNLTGEYFCGRLGSRAYEKKIKTRWTPPLAVGGEFGKKGELAGWAYKIRKIDGKDGPKFVFSDAGQAGELTADKQERILNPGTLSQYSLIASCVLDTLVVEESSIDVMAADDEGALPFRSVRRTSFFLNASGDLVVMETLPRPRIVEGRPRIETSMKQHTCARGEGLFQ